MSETLRSGASGPSVQLLSQLLVERGYLAEATTDFDRKVRRAVEAFQAQHLDPRGEPLVVDGVVGPLTWWALRNQSPPPRSDAAMLAALPSGGSTAGRAALTAAIDEMRAGARELDRNNDGPWVAKYLNGLTPPPAEWCAGFVSWCFTHAPGGMPFRYSLGARAIRDDFRRRGWLYEAAKETPAPGDIVVWWRGQPDGRAGHIGLVYKSADGILTTIEGNKGNFPAPVRTFRYVLGRIDRLLGFGRVP